jgi:hypothetical protein
MHIFVYCMFLVSPSTILLDESTSVGMTVSIVASLFSRNDPARARAGHTLYTIHYALTGNALAH